MKKIEKQLKREMEERVPSMSEKLRSFPITASSEPKKRKSLRWYWIGAFALTALLCVCLPFLFKKSPAINETFYVIEINPTILISVDTNHRVTAIKSGNSDADEVLVGLESYELVGIDFKNALETIADEVLRLGYFTADSKNAVRVSSVNDTNPAVSAGEILEEYFCEKGYYVAVLEKPLDFESFNEKYDTALSGIADFKKYMNQLADLKIADTDFSQFDYVSDYKENYFGDYLKTNMQRKLNEIAEIEACLTEMTDTYFELLELPLNQILVKDYWLVLAYYDRHPEELTEEIKAYMDTMESCLTQYEELTGIRISGGSELMEIYSLMQSYSYESIQRIIENINTFMELCTEEYLSWIENLADFFDYVIPSFAEDIRRMSTLPQTAEEYISLITEIYQTKSLKRKQEYQEEYNRPKSQITAEEYQTFMDSLIEKYGSLDSFWETI